MVSDVRFALPATRFLQKLVDDLAIVLTGIVLGGCLQKPTAAAATGEMNTIHTLQGIKSTSISNIKTPTPYTKSLEMAALHNLIQYQFL